MYMYLYIYTRSCLSFWIPWLLECFKKQIEVFPGVLASGAVFSSHGLFLQLVRCLACKCLKSRRTYNVIYKLDTYCDCFVSLQCPGETKQNFPIDPFNPSQRNQAGEVSPAFTTGLSRGAASHTRLRASSHESPAQHRRGDHPWREEFWIPALFGR